MKADDDNRTNGEPMQDAAIAQDPRLVAALYWQRLAVQGLLHPLSCRAGQGHRPLEPRAGEKGEAILVCVDCGYATLVPEPILRIWQAMNRTEGARAG